MVADDHPLFRAGVVSSLREVPGLEVIGEAGDAAGALALAREHLPDVVVLDVAMPGGGLNAARDITAACPATRVVMLTVSEDEDDILAAMKAGASGYVLKGAGRGRAHGGHPRRSHAGEVYVAPALAWGLLREMSRPRATSARRADAARARGPGAGRRGAEQPGDRRPAAASPRRPSSTT